MKELSATLQQHADAVESLSREFNKLGLDTNVMPASSPMTMKIGASALVLRDERAQNGLRICVEFKQGDQPAGVMKWPSSWVVVHLLSNGAVAAPCWWIREQVEWRLCYRSSWVQRVGDAGGMAVMIPVASLALSMQDSVAVVSGPPIRSAVDAFIKVLPYARGENNN
jgi:hypothetical protein